MIRRAILVLLMRSNPRLDQKLKYARMTKFSWRQAWKESGAL